MQGLIHTIVTYIRKSTAKVHARQWTLLRPLQLLDWEFSLKTWDKLKKLYMFDQVAKWG